MWHSGASGVQILKQLGLQVVSHGKLAALSALVVKVEHPLLASVVAVAAFELGDGSGSGGGGGKHRDDCPVS